MKKEKILIFRTGHLGDMLITLPAFWTIREHFPTAELTLLSNGSSGNVNHIFARHIFPETGLFDCWLSYPGESGKIGKMLTFAKLFWEIKREKFDRVIYLMNRNRSQGNIERDLKFFKKAGVAKIEGVDYLLDNLISAKDYANKVKVDSEHLFFLKCLESNQIFARDENKTELLLSPVERETASQWLKKNCVEAGNAKLVAIAPGSKWASKIWEEDKFVRAGQVLIEKKNIFPIIFGGAEDRDVGQRLIERWGIGANAAGVLNIRQAAAALEKCAVYVGNDTGTMHLAAASGVRCVGLFAAVDLEGRWNPIGENHQIIRKNVECAGCHSENSLNNNLCLKLITTDEVFEAASKILDAAG